MKTTKFAAAIVSLTLAAGAHAEGRIRIAEQFGVTYLLLNIAQEQKLIDKYGKRNGVDIAVEWTKLSGGAAINDALLSAASTSPAPESARSSRCGTARRTGKT